MHAFTWQDLLTKFNNESITYDNIGNPLTIGNKTLTWMNGRELSTYNDGNNNISYKYNLNGIRTKKIVNNIETKYYLEGTKIIFEDRNNTMLYYLYNGDELLGLIYNGNTYYYHKNVFGDILGILNSNYDEIVTYEYDSWGSISSIVDNSGINLGTINPFRYRSYYYDEETKLYYLNSRYYNPEWGRFINGDSIITGQGVVSNNIFCYCNNSPIIVKDNSGNFLITALVTIGIGALAGAASQYAYNVITGNENRFENVLEAACIGAVASGIGGMISIAFQPVVSAGIISSSQLAIFSAGYSNLVSAQIYYNMGLSNEEETLINYTLAFPLGMASAPVGELIENSIKNPTASNIASFTHSTVDNLMGNGYNDVVKKIAKTSSTKTKNNKKNTKSNSSTKSNKNSSPKVCPYSIKTTTTTNPFLKKNIDPTFLILKSTIIPFSEKMCPIK